MSAFRGPQGPGASRRRRELKRAEAAERNARTPWDRRRGAYWIAFEDGCERGYDRDGTECAGVLAETHEPDGVHVPRARRAA